MRTFISYVLITMLTFGLVMNEASAKRFGGGRSFGVQRSQSSLFSSHTPTNKSFTQQSSTRKWGGLLGGLLVGGLLASLFMGHGLGAGLFSWLLIGALVLFVMAFLRKKRQSPYHSAANASGFDFSRATSSMAFGAEPNNASDYPSDFDKDAFLREAKVTFLRLQTAYDQKNRQDLSSFTAPEVFAEIEMQLTERGDAPNTTEVMNLNADLLDFSKQTDSMMASVRFTGSVKENADPSVAFDEIWHFRQFIGQQNWVVGGIQQVS